MATSAVPAAVDALLAILRAAAGLSGVSILDGPPVTGGDITDPDLLFVGWQPGSEAAASLTQSFNAAGARTRDESFEVACYAEARSGDTDMAARRTRAFVIVAEVETAIRATVAAPALPTLSGTVLWAHLTTGNLVQVQTDKGSVAGVLFTIACRARI